MTNRTTLKLSELFLSTDNMRKASASKKADARLKASIAAKGIIQNLIVSQKTDSGYPVEAGGRRFAQCQELIKEGVLTGDSEVPVLILPEGQTTKDISLVENYMRAATHPVDDFEAFTHMIEKDGLKVADVAKQFGESSKYIKQRLLLGNVAPELRELCRNGKFDTKILEAFTVSDNHEKQIEAYNKFKGDVHTFSDTNIKVFLTDEALTSESKFVKFVGLKEYKKAGGVTSADMFENTTYISDRELLDSLVEKKMKPVVSKLLKAWRWVEVDYKLQAWEIRNHKMIAKELSSKAPKRIIKSLEETKKRLDELNEMDKHCDSWTEELEEEWYAIDDKIDEIETSLDDYMVPVKDEMQFAGCIVTLNDKGEVVIHDGLVKDEDWQALNEYRNPVSENVDNSHTEEMAEQEQPEVPMYSEALRLDLKAYNRSIGKRALVQDVALGSDLAMFGLCYQVFKSSWGHTPLEIDVKSSFVDSSKKDIVDSKSNKELEDCFAGLDRSWVVDGHLNSFKAFRALSTKAKKELCAYAAAYSFTGDFYQSEPEFMEYVFEESKIEPSDYFRPTANNFFKRLKEPHFTKVATEILGEKWLEENKTKKRPFIAARLEEAVSGDAPKGIELSQEILDKWMPKVV